MTPLVFYIKSAVWLVCGTLFVAVDSSAFQLPATVSVEYNYTNVNLNLVLLEKDDSKWLAVDVKKQNFPDLSGTTRSYIQYYNGYYGNYENKVNYGNLTIKAVSTAGIFPKNIFFTFVSAKRLYANSLNLTQLDAENFQNDNALDFCDLSHNQLRKIPSWVFSDAKNLETIVFSFNQIEIIEENAFDAVSGEIRAIRQIFLDNNHLTFITEKLFRNLSALQVITLNNNFIEKVDGIEFAGNPKLQYLYLHKNALMSIQNSDSQQNMLYQFSIQDNPNIRDAIPFAAMIFNITNSNATTCFIHSLTEKILASSNNIELIIILNPNNTHSEHKIKTLRLSHNLINNPVNISALHSLEILDLSHNLLTNIEAAHFNNLSELRDLNISNNKIKNVDLSFLPQTIKLDILNIAYNHLGVFRLNYRTESLQTLRIDGNGLSILDLNLKQMAPALKSVGLDGNNWECEHLTTSLLLLYFDGIAVLKENINDLSTELENDSTTVGRVKGIQCIKSVAQRETGLDISSNHSPAMQSGEIAAECQSVKEDIESVWQDKLNKLELKLVEVFNKLLAVKLEERESKVEVDTANPIKNH